MNGVNLRIRACRWGAKNASFHGRDGTLPPWRDPPRDIDVINAELQRTPHGRHGVPSLPERPCRKTRPHSTPLWLPDETVWFITICCRDRYRNQLAREPAASTLLNSALLFHQRRWFIHLFLLMPDHLHALIGFPPHEEMKQVVSAWKKYQAAHSSIVWKRDFFDHRLRHDESFEEKASYIQMNPVRAGHVATPGDWPYVLAFNGRDGTPCRPPHGSGMTDAELQIARRTARSAVPTKGCWRNNLR